MDSPGRTDGPSSTGTARVSAVSDPDGSVVTDLGASMRPVRSQNNRSSGILVYLLVIVSLQIFLMVVAVEGVMAHKANLAIASAVLSVLLAAMAFGFRWFIAD